MSELDLAAQHTSVHAGALPESLLVPVLDEAGDVLRTLEFDAVPAVLRPLVGFDRRGLARGAARQTLVKALDLDDDFRSAVIDAFLDRPEVMAAISAWSPEQAVEVIRDASLRSDLGLVASALWAGRPQGWEFGLGVAVAMADRVREEQAERDDAVAVRTEIEGLEEARRRADVQRRAAEEQASRLERELKEERRSRRAREEEAAREARAAEARADQLASALERERASVEATREKAQREAERAREADREARDARRQLEHLERENQHLSDRLARAPEAGSGLRSEDVQALLDAAEHAQRLTSGLTGVASHLRRARANAAQEEAAQAAAAQRAAERGEPMPAVTRSSRPKRAVVAPPPGMITEDPVALEAMLRTPGVMLVIDGYNVSMAGWGGESIRIQRDRLLNACAALHARLRCAITLVFDGADVEGVPVPRRPGVHVVFSEAGQEADHVVVEGVKSLPFDVPVIVASSDHWVREHSEQAGARVVAADAILRVLR